MEVYLIRHTTPKVDKGICYGQADLDLLPSFPAEQKKITETLPALDRVYCSPSKRCLYLAQKITPTPIVDKRLMEISFGEWEMKAWKNLPKSELNTWMKNFVNAKPPKGESMMELRQRVMEWWEERCWSRTGKVAVVTHSGVIRVLHAYYMNIPLSDSFKDFQVNYGEIKMLKVSASEKLTF